MTFVEQTDITDIFTDIQKSYHFGGIIFHTDLMRLGIIRREMDKDNILRSCLDALSQSCQGRELIFPTFNYDFTKTGQYQVQTDPCQVGALNEFVRVQPQSVRTRTPIFNFAILNHSITNLNPATNPFDETSNFNQFAENDYMICFFGALFSYTFLHHVEEVQNIGYRYLKLFHGKIIDDDFNETIELAYRVRPLTPTNIIEYNWAKIESDLLDNAIMSKYRLGAGHVCFFSAHAFKDFVLEKFINDEYYSLTEYSKEQIRKLTDKYGYPFMYGDFE